MNSSPSIIDDLLQRGLVDHRAGRLAQAESVYRQILNIDPEHADAHLCLGAALHALGRPMEAEASYREVLRLRPNYPEAHRNLAYVLRALGRLTEAEASYRETLRLRPNSPEAHSNLGNALNALGRPAEAEASYREALRLRPNFPEAHSNLGTALHALGRLAEAEASCQEALRLQPDYPEAHYNLGVALNDLDRPAEAEASYREALRLRPNFPEAHSNLGNALYVLGRLAEAEASYREALRLRPNFPEAHSNLGNALNDLGRPAEAEASYRAALRLRPNFPEAHSNLGNALNNLVRPAEAEASCREALRLRPDYPEAHYNLGRTLLLAGRFEEGWKEYEWRWMTKMFSIVARDFSAPLWKGEAIGNRTILLHAEQGFGDTLQFCRYAALMASGARIILEVQAPLLRLMSRLPGVTQIIARGDRLPPFDLHCPLMSLPHIFGTTLDTIPARTPYLSADRTLVANWQERLVGLDGLRIGLVWAGAQWLNVAGAAAVAGRRSIALKSLAALGEVSGVRFVSLQKGEPAAQAADSSHGLTLYDFTTDLHDFEDTAALIVNLDLVVSVDTAVAHLAGALGKPVWLLNHFETSWRWLLNRDDSPWYPTLRQFRQPRPDDWNSVVCAARQALQRLMVGDCDQLLARRSAS